MPDGPVFEPEPGWGGRLNAWFHGNMLFAIALAGVILLAILLLVFKGMPDRHSLTTSAPLSSPTSTPSPIISELVRKGDSYTLIARRAIANLTLEPGQALYTETILAQKINNQPLKAGLTITIPQTLIDTILADYKNLTSSQKSKWEAMARP